jgi:GDP-4-dehydro-6-deoxy-D-mannose reductase
MRPRLVTGAAGFAGRHLLRLIGAEERPVVGWHRPDTPPVSVADPGAVRWQAVDLRDADAVEAAVADAPPVEVYHLAGAANQGASWDHADEALHLNALATHHLLGAMARHAPDARVLVTASAAIYAPAAAALDESAPIRPTSPYGVSKLAQEMVALRTHAETGLAVLVVRPFNHTGPGQEPAYFAPSFARQIARIETGLEPPVLHVGNLEARRDISDVRDVVRAYERLMAMGLPGEVYNVCRGDAYVIGDLLHQLVARSRVELRVETDPARLRPSDTPLLLGDRSRVSTLTGWAPEIAIEQTLDDILDEQRAAVRTPST